MAFCAVTLENIKNLTLLVHATIRKNPSALKSFKQFSKDIVNNLVGRGVSLEKAITLGSYLPQIISEFNSEKEDRKLLKEAGVSLDAINDVEDQFDTYKSLAAYLEIKNESNPIIPISTKQSEAEEKVDAHIKNTNIEFEGDVRKINGKKYNIRVTSIAKAGFTDEVDPDAPASPALKHGNTVDVLAKNIFDDITPQYSDYQNDMTELAFEALVSKMKALKSDLIEKGYTFKTGVTVYDKKLSISGEIDLLAINENGEAFILDFKTANQRFNEPYLRNDVLTFKSDEVSHSVKILSKWNQYVTQGYIYSLILQDQLGLPPIKQVGIIGINISYDSSVPAEISKIQKVVDINVHNISFSDVRAEYKGKTLAEIVEEYKVLETKSLGTVTELKPTKKREKYKDINPEKPLDRLSSIEEIAATESELKKEIDWFKSNPIGKDVLLRIDDIVNSGLFGQWTLDGITIHRFASKGTVYHEGWHRFSQVFMSQKEKENLYESVRKDAIRFRTRDGRNINTANASYLDIEEFLAEQFAKYALAPENYIYPTANNAPKSLFQRIWDFLKRFFGVNPRPITLFQKLYTGKVGEYIPSVNNAFWGKLNSIVENKNGEEIISNERFPIYVRAMDYLISDQLKRYKKTFTAFKQSKVLQATVLDNITSILNDKLLDPKLTDQQYEEIRSILNPENRYYFNKAYFKATAYDTLKGFNLTDDIYNFTAEQLDQMEEIAEEYEDVEVPDYDEEESASKPERFDRSGAEDSAMSLADDALQDFFRSIPKIKDVTYNDKGEIVNIEYELDELGFPTNHTYYDVFYKTKRMLEGAFNMNEMIARMNSLNNQRLFPELKIIAESLAVIMDNKTEKNFYRAIQNLQFIQSFYHVMSMPEVKNMQLTQNFIPIKRDYKTFKPIMVSYRVASRSLALKIIQGWEKDFMDRRNKTFTSFENFETDKTKILTTPLYKTEDGKLMFNPLIDYSRLYNTEKISDLRNFFELLGIKFNNKVFQDPQAISELKEAKSKYVYNLNIYKQYVTEQFYGDLFKFYDEANIPTENFTSPSDYIENAPPEAIDTLIKQWFIANPITFFNDKREYTLTAGKNDLKLSTNTLRFVIEDIASIEEIFGDRVSSGAFRIEDKTKYPYYIPNRMLITTSLLNKVNSFNDFSSELYLEQLDPLKNPWIKRSYFMKNMFDHNGQRVRYNKKPVTIEVEDIASVVVKDEDSNGVVTTVEKHPRSLNRNEKFFADVLTLFEAGAIETPRAETSSTIFSIRLSNYDGKKLPIIARDILGKFPETFHSIVKDYFAAEIEKRQWYIKNDTKIKGANKKPLADQFNVFQGILPAELIEKVEKYLDLKADEIFTKDNIEREFRKAIEDYFNSLITKLRPRFEALSKSQRKMLSNVSGIPGDSTIPLARMFVLNHFVLSQEFYNLYFGDLYFYKNAFKRGKFVTNTGNTFFIDDYRNQLLNGIQKSTMHSIITGNPVGTRDFRYLNTSTIEDVELSSAYVDKNDANNRLLNDIINARVASGYAKTGSPEFIGDIEKFRQSLKKYQNINIADGQGIISLDFYRNFSIITNIWSEEKEMEYERQKAIFRMNTNAYYKKVGDELVPMDPDEMEEEKANDKRLASVKAHAYFNPLKISYTGPQVAEGPMRPVFDKFSVRPIIPEAAFGKRDEKLLIEMSRKNIDYIKFKSGSKVHNENIFNWFNKNDDGTYNLRDFTTEEITPDQLYAGYLKHQLSTEGIKEENILGSQFRKIVFGVKYSSLVKNNSSLVSYFTKLETDFQNSIRDMLQVEQLDLFSLLGVEIRNNSFYVADMKRFLKLLQDESNKRGIAVNNIDYIQYNEVTKNATHPIDYAFNRQQIQDLLSGLLDERLRRLKVNGSSLIQVSHAGYENKGLFKRATDEQLEKYGTAGLHYYHIEYDDNGNLVKTSTMGVKVALTKDYENLLKLPAPESFGTDLKTNIQGETKILTDRIGTLERLNRAMKDPVWKKKYEKLFQLIGYRIPTQNNNFIDNMEIMEFLPSSAGGIIIAPYELIIKSGSDFDIDKMNVIKPSIGGSGNIVETPTESISEIYKQIEALTFDEKQFKYDKKQLENMLQTTSADINKVEEIHRKVVYSIIDLAIKMNVPDSIIDKIIDNVTEKKKQGKKFIVPDKSNPEEDVFTDEEILQWRDLHSERLDDLVKMETELTRLKERYGSLSEQHVDIKKSTLGLFDKKRNFKKAANNRMIDILSKTLSHPYYFELLVTPSSAAMFENWTNEMIASEANLTEEQYQAELERTEGKLYDSPKTPQQSSTYDATAEAFDNLLSKRKDLGGYAIQRTFADIFNFANFSIAKEYSYMVSGSPVTKIIHTPLMSPEQRLKSLSNGRLLMYGDSVTGIPIKNSFDELISLTVDLAGSPAYPHMGINTFNKKHVQYLIHQKNDPKMVMWLMKQPILMELYDLYENKRDKISGYTLKHAMVELGVRKKILIDEAKWPGGPTKYDVIATKKVDVDSGYTDDFGQPIMKKAYMHIEGRANQWLSRPYYEASQYLTEADEFKFEDLDNSIRTKDKNSELQKKVLAYFITITEEADELMKVQFANNVDTNKYATLTSLIRNENNRREIRNKTTLFDNRQLDIIEKESMISIFDYTAKAKSILKSLFPKLYTDNTIDSFSNLINDIWGVRNIQIERISKIVENDFIEFIYKNYGTYNGQNISQVFESQLINTDGTQDHEFFSYRMIDLLSEFPELKSIPFVNALYEDVYYPPDKEIPNSYEGLDGKEIHNIFFLRNPDNPTFEKNIFTSNWRNLINFDPQKLSLTKDYTSQQVQKISSFFDDLVYFSLYQSGLTNTGNGFSDLIPYEKWAHFIESAFDVYDREKERNINLEESLLKAFELRFRSMNPKIGWRTKSTVIDIIDLTINQIEELGIEEDYEYFIDQKNGKIEIPINFFKNYYRGKQYFVTDDQLGFLREFVYPEKATETPAVTPVAEVKPEPGRYVKYKNDVYIITKPLGREGLWQIYNPLLIGPKAKLSVSAKNLIIMKEMGIIVPYGLKTYIVTAKSEIIDLDDNKKVSWSKDNRNRKNILGEAARISAESGIGPDGKPKIPPPC